MKRIILTAIIIICGAVEVNAQWWNSNSKEETAWNVAVKQDAFITFRNKSDYSMVLKIMHPYGGCFREIVLPDHSSRTVSFSKSGTFKLKIKATPRNGYPSYHDGGRISVTCTDTEWTEGEMSFEISTYGSGLGPSISKAEFESNN